MILTKDFLNSLSTNELFKASIAKLENFKNDTNNLLRNNNMDELCNEVCIVNKILSNCDDTNINAELRILDSRICDLYNHEAVGKLQKLLILGIVLSKILDSIHDTIDNEKNAFLHDTCRTYYAILGCLATDASVVSNPKYIYANEVCKEIFSKLNRNPICPMPVVKAIVKSEACNESADTLDNVMIKTDYGTNTTRKGNVTIKTDASDVWAENLITTPKMLDDRDDYYISDIHKLVDFAKPLNDVFDQKRADAIIAIIDNYTDTFYDTNNLNILGELHKAITAIIGIIVHTDETARFCAQLSGRLEVIDFDKKSNATDALSESSCMYDLGLGYIYDVLPENIDDINESTIGTIIEGLNSYNKNDGMFDTLVENIFDDIKAKRDARKEYKKQVAAMKYENKLDKKKQEYTEAEEKKTEKKARKKALKNSKDLSLEKAEIKREVKLSDYRKEKEDNLTAQNLLGTKYKALTLTNKNAKRVNDALSKSIKAVSVGGVAALAGINPILAGVTYLSGKWIKDKTAPLESRRKFMGDLRDQLAVVENKIDKAQQTGNVKEYEALVKMRNKLNTLYTNANFSMTRREVI